MVFVRAFESEYEVIFAATPELLEQVHRIRFQVYCQEFGFEPESKLNPGQEIDEFDGYSHHYLIRQKRSGLYVGTIRMVKPSPGESRTLPVDSLCQNATLERRCNSEAAEIGRLAVLKEFRNLTLSHPDIPARLRAIPIVSTALYIAIAAECFLTSKLKHVYLIAEPRLARHLKTIGFEFEQLGPVIDFHGQRAPFVLKRDQWKQSFRGQLLNLYLKLLEELEEIGVNETLSPQPAIMTLEPIRAIA